MSTITFRGLVCKDLKYCCPYAFICLYKKTETLTERLGLDRSTIQAHKRKWKAGEYKCEQAGNCLAKKISLRAPPRDQSR